MAMIVCHRRKGKINLHLRHPFIPVVGTEFPWCKIIFNIAEHTVPFLWRIAFFHNKAAPQFKNNAERADAYRAFLYAGIAGGAGTQFFGADIIV